jgi:predicted NAD-dependent protein-ADP-ribosyltransferase YbiA (DUF1768 family)
LIKGRMSDNSIDIASKAPYPAGALSNFAPHAFTFDGIACASMESFLQGLKFEDAARQAEICGYKAGKAQGFGRRRNWQAEGRLWWRGEPVERLSGAYQALLDRAYEALFAQSEAFRQALAATGEAELVHTMGRIHPVNTVLTADEFCSRLMRLRARLRTA